MTLTMTGSRPKTEFADMQSGQVGARPDAGVYRATTRLGASVRSGSQWRTVPTAAPSYDQRLNALRHLSSGWDGHRAAPPAPIALETAARIAQTLEEHELRVTRIAPSVVGGIGITLRTGGKKFYIEVYNSGLVYVLQASADAEPRSYPVRAESSRDRSAIAQQARAHLGN